MLRMEHFDCERTTVLKNRFCLKLLATAFCRNEILSRVLTAFSAKVLGHFLSEIQKSCLSNRSVLPW